MDSSKNKQGFTLIELIATIAIIVILTLAILYVLNPAELLKQGRDGNRVESISTLNRAISLYYSDAMNNPTRLNMGSSSVIYISIPDLNATTTAGTQCQNLGLPLLPSGWSYKCAASSTYLKTDGTGWIPINFNTYPSGSPIASLPVDPVNTTSSCYYYAYATNGTNYVLTSRMESQKDQFLTASDTGQYPDLYEKGPVLSLLPSDIGGGTVYSVSTANNVVQLFNGCNGQYLSQFSGSGANTLNGPYGIGANPTTGRIYVLNLNNSHVEIFDANGNYISQFGSAGTGNGQFTNSVSGIAVNSSTGNVYVGDGGHGRVEIFDANGNYISQFGTPGSSTPQQFDGPNGIAINPLNGNVDVADYYNSRIQVWSATGTYLWQIGNAGNGYSSGTIIDPIGVATDAFGNVYVASWCAADRVDIFSATGTFLSRIGSSGNGPGQFDCPHGITIGPGGNIYVADKGNNRVQVFNASGTYLWQFSQTNPTFLLIQ